jgi:uncharacterized protein
MLSVEVNRMGSYRPLVILFFMAARAGLTAVAPEVSTMESGTFLLFQGGKQVGKETYLHQTDGTQQIWTADVELQVGGASLKQRPKLVLGPGARPVSYDLSYSAGGAEQSLSYKFDAGTYSVAENGGEPVQRPMPADAVILGNNIIHHILLLARKYDWTKMGRQEFTSLPRTNVAMEGRGKEQFRNGGTMLELRHLFLSIGGVIGANLYLDDQERLIKMEIPLQRVDVFLEGFENMEPVVKPESPSEPGIEAVDVTFPSGDHTMAGTLTLPGHRSGRIPAVILITGSGPQNRDEDSIGAGGLKLGFFRVMAERLTAAGIGVLRYDDRGVGASGGNFAAGDMTDFEDDARAAIECLKGRPEVDPARIGIVGHSEGAILGARIAAKQRDIKALVSLAGTARNGEAILRFQSQEALSKMNLSADESKAAADRQERFFAAVRNAEGDIAEIDGQNINVRWFKEFLAYDPTPTMRQVTCAVAILQGERDVQCPPDDARTLDRALTDGGNRRHVLKLFPNLGHMFTESTGEGIAELADNQKKVSPDVLEFVALFLRNNL